MVSGRCCWRRRAGRSQISAVLLQAGANPNAQDRFGRTALQEVAQRGDLVLAKLLLRHGADATIASRHGDDALQLARRTGHDALWSMLRASAPVARRLGLAAQEVAGSLPGGTSPADVQDTVPLR